MKKYLLSLGIILTAVFSSFAQSIYPIRADTVKIIRPGGNSELVVENATKNVKGIATNTGGGLMQYIKSKLIGDTVLVIGLDSIKLTNIGGLQQVQNIAALRNYKGPTNGFKIDVTGYYNAGDRGGGQFYWSDTSVIADNGGTVIKVNSVNNGRWKRIITSGEVNVRWFGARGRGITGEDSEPVQRAINTFKTTGSYIVGRGAITMLFEGGTFRLKDIVVQSGIRLTANQKPANNTYAVTNTTIVPDTGAQYIFIFPDTCREATLEHMDIDGEYQTSGKLKAAVSLSGAYNKILYNNIQACANAAVLVPSAATTTIKDNFLAGQFRPDLTFRPDTINKGTPSQLIVPDTADYRGALQINICGDSYIVDNEFSGALPYFQEYNPQYKILRDTALSPNGQRRGRICAVAARVYFGNSVFSGNIVENGDRGMVVRGSVYSYFGANRYELNGVGGFYMGGSGSSYNINFIGERYANNSMAGDTLYDDITLEQGSTGHVSFIAPTFLSLPASDLIPASKYCSRHNMTNYASLEVSWVEPSYNIAYTPTQQFINTNLPAFPVRQTVGQYYPEDVVHKSSLTIGSRKPSDSLNYKTRGYVRIDGGTTADNGNRTGLIGGYKSGGYRTWAIGFDSDSAQMSFALTNPGFYTFANGYISSTKSGDNGVIVRSNTGGTTSLKLSNSIFDTTATTLSTDGTTGQTNLFMKNNMVLLSGTPGNIQFTNNDITVAKPGTASILMVGDGTGVNSIGTNSNGIASHSFRMEQNNITGKARLTSGDSIHIGLLENMSFAPNGYTLLKISPAPANDSTLPTQTILTRDTVTKAIKVLSLNTFAPSTGGNGYIRNGSSTQTASYNINGNGVIGNTMSVAIGSVGAYPLQVGTLPSTLNVSAQFLGTVIGAKAHSAGEFTNAGQFINGLTFNNDSVKWNGPLNQNTNIFSGPWTINLGATDAGFGGNLKIAPLTSEISASNSGLPLTRVQTWTDGVSTGGIKLYDLFNKGAVYEADYSGLGLIDPRWIPDIAAVRRAIHDSLPTGSTIPSGTGNQFYATPNGSSGNAALRSIVPADLGTGTMNSSTFLRGDGTFSNTINGNFNISGGGRLNVNSTTTPQGRFAYDVSNYFDIATGSQGNVTLTAVGTSPSITTNQILYTLGGIFTSNASTSSGNLNAFGGGASGTGLGSSGIIFGGSSTVGAKVTFNGVTGTSQGANQSFANVIFGAGNAVTSTTGTHKWATNVVIREPLLALAGTAIIDSSASLLIDGPPSIGNNKFSFAIRSGNAKLNNTYITAPTYSTGGNVPVVLNSTTGRLETLTTSVPTLDQVTTAGNTTSNIVNVGALGSAGTVVVGGSLVLNPKVVTTSYSILTSDNVVLVDNASAVTLSLPTAIPAFDGKTYIIKKINGNSSNVTIQAASGQNIDASNTYVLGNWISVMLICKNNTWYVN